MIDYDSSRTWLLDSLSQKTHGTSYDPALHGTQGNGEALGWHGLFFPARGHRRGRRAWVLQLLVQCSFLFYQAETESSNRKNVVEPVSATIIRNWQGIFY